MKNVTVFTLLLAVAIVSSAIPASAQEPQREAIAVESREAVPLPLSACPAPIINLTLSATTPNVFTGDFTAPQLANQVGLNFGGTDKHFLHTFQWKPQHCCCQITKAVLTVKMKANQSGQSATSSDAGNDAFNVMHLGSSLTPPSGPVYSSFGFAAGNMVTKTLILPATILADLNANHRLSIDVQDDTSVLSATLQLSGCCLTQ